MVSAEAMAIAQECDPSHEHESRFPLARHSLELRPRLQDGNARTNGGLRGFFPGAYTGADHPGHVFVFTTLGGYYRCATNCSFRETSPLERGRQQAISYC